DFFVTINAAGVRLANANGLLELRAPTGVITAAMRAAAAEHKSTLLTMLRPTPSSDEDVEIELSPTPTDAQHRDAEDWIVLEAEEEMRTEREAIVREGNSEISPVELKNAVAQWDSVVASDDVRPLPDWSDWRFEWLMEVGRLFLRMRSCSDPEV